MDNSKYPLFRSLFYGSIWAITETKWREIETFLQFAAAGGTYSAEELAERFGAVARPQARNAGAVAVLPLYGVIAHRAGMLSDFSGGTSTERFTQSFRQALADPGVGSILLDVDSPGGTVDGVPELADEIFRARGQKPIVAIANTIAASAAYWIATAADELYVTPSGEVGSVGVFVAHQDESGAYERMGVKTTLIASSPYKTEGNPYEPLTEEARADLQGRVDDYHGMFVEALARHRGLSAAQVEESFGQGRTVPPKAARAAGMVDGVMTFDQAVQRASRLARQSASGQRATASMQDYELRRRRLDL